MYSDKNLPMTLVYEDLYPYVFCITYQIYELGSHLYSLNISLFYLKILIITLAQYEYNICENN